MCWLTPSASLPASACCQGSAFLGPKEESTASPAADLFPCNKTLVMPGRPWKLKLEVVRMGELIPGEGLPLHRAAALTSAASFLFSSFSQCKATEDLKNE